MAGGVALNAKTTAGLLFILMIVLNLGLLWLNHYIPTQDGPCHLENALHLRDKYLCDGTGCERFYRLKCRTGSNLLYHATVAAFAAFLPPFLAERLFLSLYIAGFAGATYALARSAGARTAIPAIAALPYALGFPYHMGFFNYCVGLALAYATWAYFWRRRDNLRGRGFIILNAAAVFAYLTHVGAAVILVAGVFVLNAWLAATEKARGPAARKKRLAAFAGLLPGWILPVYFLVITPPAKYAWTSISVTVLSFLAGASFRFFSPGQLYLGIASWAVLLLAIVLRVASRGAGVRPWRQSRNGLLVLALGTVALYFLAPDTGHGFGVLTGRLMVIPGVIFFMWAGDNFSRASRWVMLIAATAFALAFWADTLVRYRHFNRQLRDLCSGVEAVEEGSRMCYLNFSGCQYHIAVFASAGSYYALGRDVMNFNNSEGDQPTFPVRFDYPASRPMASDLRPFRNYRVKKFARVVDYVVTWGLPDGEPIAKKLHWIYRPVYARGRVQVFRVRDKYRGPPPR